ncbi:MAG TPA: PHB depolymerase family esterase [Legionella sp.]|nr:PHB depolymerase family esterase [Legionella sp.]
MFLYKNLSAPLSVSKRALISDNATVATAAIQKALKQMSGDMVNNLKSQNQIPGFVTDLLSALGVSLPDGGGLVDQDVSRFKHKQPNKRVQTLEEYKGQFLTKSFSNHAGTREYKVYIPSSYRGEKLPVMVMLHGCTQNPDDFARGTQMNALAEEEKCFVIYPAQSQSANSSKCWNWFNAMDQQRDQGEPSIIAGITRQVIKDYNLDSRRVYVAGLSSGGAMAVIMGITYPDLYAAVGVHSGLPYGSAQNISSAFAAMRRAKPAVMRKQQTFAENSKPVSVPIIVFHGDRDATVHCSNADELIHQNVPTQAANQVDSQVIIEEGKVPNGHSYTRTLHQDKKGHIIAEHWIIHGAGHAWSGGSRKGSYTDAKGPNATEEMMRFFRMQSE